MQKKFQFFDIAANLADESFQGIYYNKKIHESDIESVIQRATSVGCEHLLIVGGNIQDSINSFQIAQKSPNFYCTVGVHPCRATEVEANAVGECGLDYDRFEYASKEAQLKQFEPHFALAEKHQLPIYFHNRNTGDDFFNIVKQNRNRFSSGVVHSFTGTSYELKQIIDLNLYIGINGCSLRDEKSIEVIKEIPLDKMMIETDCPYCEIRNTHPGKKFIKTVFEQKKKEKFSKEYMVRGRNEPCQIVQVLEVLAGFLNLDEKVIADACFQNTLKFFGIQQNQKL
ncbi:hypothetical protein IMG5_183120 [Ichthyophthirius multifiliis]|uniref:Uncharacterized protein n=1 Tax=Ichthyophthirius multifiliis TaxID=5932 RepID=G0R350_ICHMU|nr:hypothetical protein IMG5_183120 [Ichthyophthirius multifiliis]EGR28126.1 hypothetical protein IMG5_183120 [Ichthyophthirius multifiliis]|eukprot:XP_004027471.1 hypothetical protein IMG5_183120 [Ichthyophthirius multifiliis]